MSEPLGSAEKYKRRLLRQATRLRPNANKPADFVVLSTDSPGLTESTKWYLGSDLNPPVINTLSDAPSGSTILVQSGFGDISLPALTKALASHRVVIVDPEYHHGAEVSGGTSLLWREAYSKNDREKTRQLSDRLHREMLAELGDAKSCLVVTTGPSINDISLKDLADKADVRIACNSIVKDEQLFDEVKPNILVFGDPAFHFGPSPYAEVFRTDVRKVIASHNPWIVIPEFNYPLLKREFTDTELERVIPARMSRVSADRAIKTDAAYPRRAANILTLLMLPLARQVASERIAMVGCDGRSKEEVGFWKHNPKTQYGDLYQTVVDAHPSFFRDTGYLGYYERHCKILTAQIESLEEEGLTVVSNTPSFIEALDERFEPVGPS